MLDDEDQPIEDPAGKPLGSGLPHLALAMANLSILLSAGAAGMMDDDRAKMLELDGVLRDLHCNQTKEMQWPTPFSLSSPTAP